MLETKLFEIRDSGTFIPVMATRMQCVAERVAVGKMEDFLESRAAERHLLARAAYHGEAVNTVRLTVLTTGHTFTQPHEWQNGSRTMQTTHEYIVQRWDELHSGQVIDVEFILGERSAPKRSERHDACGGVRPAPAQEYVVQVAIVVRSKQMAEMPADKRKAAVDAIMSDIRFQANCLPEKWRESEDTPTDATVEVLP
jgi:hypothetical protein